MELSKPIRRGRVLMVSVAVVLAAGLLGATGAFAAEAKAKIEVSSAQANAGTVEVTNNRGTTTYGTCKAPAVAGKETCTIEVAPKVGVVLISHPAAGEATGAWSGSCKGTPGDVCHYQAGASGSTKTIAVTLVPGTTPVLTTSPHYAEGKAGACGSSVPSVSATGTGFPANTAVTLSDDGVEVASGMTNATGEATLSYTPSLVGEPGVYRILTMSGGGKSASNDVFNVAVLCPGQASPEPEKLTVTLEAADLDANSSNTIITVKGVKTTINANANGVGSATTPAFACPKGKTVPYTVSGTRGTGSGKYTFSLKITVTCP